MKPKKSLFLHLNDRFLEFFKDVDGTMSIKRLLAFIFSILVVVVILCNLFWNLSLTKELVDLLEYLIIALVVGISSEKFSKRGITSVQANDEVLKEEKKVELQEKKTK